MNLFHVIASAARQSIFIAACTKARWIATACGLAMTGFLLAAPAAALTVDERLPDSAQEARAQGLFHELRCVVCQSEAIADSPSEVARDMRRSVREKVAAGKSDADIKAGLVAHYGERVLMMPEKNKRNALLWVAPFLLLLVGGWLAAKNIFRKEHP